MATIKKEKLKKELSIALKEIGEIYPWFDKEVDAWVFEHPLYPVRYAGSSCEEVIKNYPRYLEVFIEHRLQLRLDEVNEKKTLGRGGRRPGAGRPKGSIKESTKQIRLPADIADWLRIPGVVDNFRFIMNTYSHRYQKHI
jgi:hypothetical protein